jgi:ATP-dependent exoDNAse (exonuclease V) beta subunit
VATIIPNDTKLHLPNFTVVSASAGSGKTHTLTLKLLQLLLSPCVPNNRLNNILAMTFTKNAAAEMRQRVLEYLKKAFHGDREILVQLLAIVAMDEEHLRVRCGELINTILEDYSSFQVQTIDSFMARVFRASALEFGFSPTLEIKLNDRPLLDAAFEQFTRDLSADPSKRILLEQLTDVLVQNQKTSSRYIWNPFQKLSDEVRKLYSTLSAQTRDVLSFSDDGRQAGTLRQDILGTFSQLCALVKESGLDITKNFETVIEIAASGDVDDLIYRKSLYNVPVKKSGATKEKTEEWSFRFIPLQERIHNLAAEYVVQQARSYYRPYVEAHRLFSSTIDQVMRRNNQVSLADVNRALLKYISEEIVPQVYYYLGDAIFHYLIDEFQDTAPVQWEALKPLLTEALSKQGSLFVVGDTKQSIYSFRHADWRIMISVMENNVFPSAPSEVKELGTNYRSYERILDFSKKVFKEIVPSIVEGNAPHASGLSSFKQQVKEGNDNKGYVEVVSFEKNIEKTPERTKILEIIVDCKKRGYSYGDITVLTPKNEHVVAISGWLNSEHIPFVSHSSLDIRGRKITGDIIALLRFLDSPIDDLAFATFLLSETFNCLISTERPSITKEQIHSFILQTRREKRRTSLYALFRTRYQDIWKQYFEKLFTVVGYLPMYDLVSEIYKQFRLFELAPEEESTLAKLLEIIKNFEEKGQNNLKDFLVYADEEGDEAEWNVNVPRGEDAVSVMTIHKAKGLDNRVVIVLLEDSKQKSDNLFIEEDKEGVRLLHIIQKNIEFSDSMKALYAYRIFERKVDDLNKLYVAFTRAREEMYIISVKSEWANEPSKILPQSGFEPTKKPKISKREEKQEFKAEIHHSSISLPAEIVMPARLALDERRRGEFIHYILSRMKFVDADIEEQISSAIKEIAGSTEKPADAARIKSLLLEFLQLPEIEHFFAPIEGRKILNEQEFVSPDGRLFRMDRVVVDADNVTVIDFKTGDDKETYSDQINGYVKILQNFYPDRTIRGVLAFVDRKKLRVIA